jgi:two-component system chemotaxis response regulator CheY
LIVDDKVFVRRLLGGLLRQRGLQCHEASTLYQALDNYHLFRPDLVIVGTLQSGISGVVAIEAIKRFDPSARVIVVMEEATRANVVAAIGAGAEDFVARPFQQERFFQAVMGGKELPPSVPEPVIAWIDQPDQYEYAPSELDLAAF